MILKHKEITFHIENSAYTVDIGPDLDDEIINGLKQFLDIEKEISIPQLLSAYLRKNSELINFKKSTENTFQNLNNFNNKIN
jgi:hypothetical protein